MAKDGIPKHVRDMLASVGVTPEEAGIKEPPVGELQRLERSQFHAEAVLHFLQYPSVSRIVKRCKECGEPFATYYKSVAYCDYPCLKNGLKRVGLLWNEAEYDYDSKTNVERWGNYEPPLVIPPAAIEAMRSLLNLIDSGNQGQEPALIEPVESSFERVVPFENDEPDVPEIESVPPQEQTQSLSDFDESFLDDLLD